MDSWEHRKKNHWCKPVLHSGFIHLQSQETSITADTSHPGNNLFSPLVAATEQPDKQQFVLTDHFYIQHLVTQCQ